MFQSTQLKVALLTYSTRPRGGVVHTLALAESLADLGVDTDVWTLGRHGDTTFFRPVDPRVGVRAVEFATDEDEDVGARIQRSISTLNAAFSEARDGYDIVHAQDCISANAALPCIRTVHHLDEFTTPQLQQCHERAIVEPSRHICVSRSVADEIRAGWGFEPTVIPGGVDAARFRTGVTDRAGRQAWRDKFGRYVVALGGIEPRKASLDLLEAFHLMRTHEAGLRDVNLVFGGGETLFDYRDYRAAFDQRATELGIRPIIVGVLSDDELPALVAEAAALAMVSTKEGFGLAGMEALAAGVPVVARDLPVLREVYGESICFAQDTQAIAAGLAAVIHDRPDPRTVQAVVDQYSWPRAARAHLELYRSVLGG